MSIFTALFGTKQEKDLKKLKPILDEVNSFSDWAKSLNNEDFPKQTEEFKIQIKEGASLDSILPKAYALVREASFRVLGERHYDVQILGAIVLHQGKLLELKTGEGKTLTCVPAAYLNSLSGNGVHIITVNDYLAERDANWMGPVYEFLGLSVGVIVSNMDNDRRKNAYSCNITYGTNNEFGFDYLRDNLKYRYEDKIQAKHSYCIIDEIDSILIDEARTPLIISAPAEDDSVLAVNAEKVTPYLKECEKDPETDDYPVFSAFARFEENAKTEPDGDFMINEKQKRISFTKEGIIHIEELLKKMNVITGSIYDDNNFEYVHYVTQAMVAKYLYKKDVDYVIQDNKIQIVDEFTGRILYGRRYSEGLHQAIEAKEHIKIYGKNRTLATITFQNFFRMYTKLSGMTGTADTESAEFNSIYNLDVVVIPTHLPIKRIDYDDSVYLNEKFKLTAICNEIKKVHETGQPILVGTVSIEKSELLSALMRKMGIPHEVLNAKNHAREASIIENAGMLGAVTIATNMAGRGTDIKLGGSPEAMARKIVGSEATPEELRLAKEKIMPKYLEQYEKVKSLGGLYILGTERHESRRIDNQLRGRSGRQGDPGCSRFFVSFDDTVMRLFAKDNIKNLMSRLGLNDGSPISHPLVSRTIENAQKRVEERNFEIRKNLLEYDDVLNEQRNFIYSQRDEILKDENIINRVLSNVKEYIEDLIDSSFSLQEKEKFTAICRDLKDIIGYDYIPELDDKNLLKNELINKIYSCIKKEIDDKINLVEPKIFSAFVLHTYLRNIDYRWQNHLEELEDLRDSVSLRSFAQKNPLLEYKLEGYDIFDDMLFKIKTSVIKTVIGVKINLTPQVQKKPAVKTIETHSASTSTSPVKQNETLPIQVIRSTPKIGRNDPCPCGSGKKYKNCHGRNPNSL